MARHRRLYWHHRTSGEPADYVHFNSVLACGDRRLLLLHNDYRETGRASEIALLGAPGP